MINLLLQYPYFIGYTKNCKKKNHEYDLFRFIFQKYIKKSNKNVRSV